MLTIDQLAASTPSYDDLAARYRDLEVELNAAASDEAAADVVHRWDALRREIETWSALVQLHFNQDTRKEEYKKARDYCDELRPKLTELSVAMKRRLLGSPRRAELEAHYGKQRSLCGKRISPPTIR
jgi:hypothetical protein